MENLPQQWRKKRRVLRTLRALAVYSTAELERQAHSAKADFILLHPCFGIGIPGDPAGLLLGHAQMGNANAEAEALYFALSPSLRDLPLALGICATDPFLLLEPAFNRWRDAGVKGVTNLPTVSALDGLFRADLEANGLGFDREVAFLALAKAQGFFTVGHACTPLEAEKLAKAEVDAVIAHLGWVSAEGGSGIAAVDLSAEPKRGPLRAPLHARNLAGHWRDWRSFVAAARKGKADALVLLSGAHVQDEADAEMLRSEGFEGDGVLHFH